MHGQQNIKIGYRVSEETASSIFMVSHKGYAVVGGSSLLQKSRSIICLHDVIFQNTVISHFHLLVYGFACSFSVRTVALLTVSQTQLAKNQPQLEAHSQYH